MYLKETLQKGEDSCYKKEKIHDGSSEFWIQLCSVYHMGITFFFLEILDDDELVNKCVFGEWVLDLLNGYGIFSKKIFVKEEEGDNDDEEGKLKMKGEGRVDDV